ncbi:MAG: type I DNA topoisomerase [Candidatus Roizmanbacteria bacterium]|nr:MAG: type I DNA topoisomerase [Candidatus Roizmanbacteria bacterium]
MTLIIVESPTKARTFNRILKGEDYYVFATMGHIRDLPASALSIDYAHKFKPNYQIIKNKQKTVDQLMKLAKQNDEIILATDPDREGESIAYHAAYLIGLIKEKWPEFKIDKKHPLKRIVFHEITPHALKEALEHPSTLRLDLVKAQQARRILDRVVGYEISPLLWKKMGKNWLSAGRVQSVALRLVVEREKEIRVFKDEGYYQIYGNFNKKEPLKAKLVSKDQVPYEQKFTLHLFAGEYQYTKTTIEKSNVDEIKKNAETDKYIVKEIKEEIKPKYPPPPFTTSLLQQESFHRFGFSSRMTMRIAQDLYERGLITYHRTDSFNLSTQFVFKAKDFIEKTFGKEYALEKPRGFRTKSKMAQEAHEAIRPTHLEKSADSMAVDKKITQNHKKVYKLIFDRALSTQMKEAQVKHIKIVIAGKKGYAFESEVQQVIFDGFLKVLNPEYAGKKQSLARLKENDPVDLLSLEVQECKTNPPPRFNEASLIKILEEKGIGRPSTYAPIISLIQDKNYVEKEFRYFVPTKLGEVISNYLAESFPDIFSLEFTAQMEQSLDEIADGQKDMVQTLSDFYNPFEKHLKIMKLDKKTIDVEEVVDEKCEKCASAMVVRYSKFGKFMACSKYPQCKFTKPFLNFVKDKFCPECGGRMTARMTKTRKRFYGCENYPKCKYSSWTLKPTKK